MTATLSPDFQFGLTPRRVQTSGLPTVKVKSGSSTRMRLTVFGSLNSHGYRFLCATRRG